MQGGARYAYASSVILMLLLIAISGNSRASRAARGVSLCLLIWSLGFWSLKFREQMNYYMNPAWPRWREEVKAWRADPNRSLQIHPLWEQHAKIGLVWSIRLRPGKKPSGDQAQPRAPSNADR
jgi:hypothetical protein